MSDSSSSGDETDVIEDDHWQILNQRRQYSRRLNHRLRYANNDISNLNQRRGYAAHPRDGVGDDVPRRHHVSKFNKWQIISELQGWSGTIKNFRQLYWSTYTGPFQHVSKVKLNTLAKWRREFTHDSEEWDSLDSYCRSHAESESRTTFTLRRNVNLPCVERFGNMPILESYLLHYRLLKARAHEYRSLRWLKHTTRITLGHPLIFQCLSRLMGPEEQRRASAFKISRGWIRKFMVCLNNFGQ